ncbi:MAG: hypothetical protein ACI4DU_08625 [Lachnospiraceae bacterium]
MNNVSNANAANNYATYTNASKVNANSFNGTDSVSGKNADSVAGANVKDSIDGVSAVYEPSAETASANETSKTNKYTRDPELINRLKQDSDAHVEQLRNIVEKLMTKQGDAYNKANGLKSFYENLVVDESTRKQAQEDISEDGYWGVKQTSERIFDFAMALTGGDPDKMEEMKSAFEKGFKQATKTWGDELPQICQDTYDTVQKKFESYALQETAEEA